MYDLNPYLKLIDEVIERGPYKDDWVSLASYRVPEWYRDAKFGIFIHWGIYSVPAFGSEWYSRNMYIQDSAEYRHHIETYGAQKEFGYKDFIPLFQAEKFDADKWAQLFQKAGARYVVPVAEHHDGFQMYRSEISHWNAYEMGPKRDVLGELKESLTRKGIEMGASSHRVEHWFFMGHGKEFDSDIKEPMERGDFYWPAMEEPDHYDMYSKPTPTKEYLQDWLVRTCEIIDRYHPRILYFDWWIQHSAVKPYLKKLAAYYYNRAFEWGEEVVINYKHDAFVFGTAVPDVERGQFAEMKPYFWQTDTAVALNSWGYTENNRYKKPEDILCDLVDIVSKNGCLLLNIGPRADGSIPEEDEAILRAIGKWIEINGEAIYGTRVWRKYGEGVTNVPEGQFSDWKKKEFTPEDFRFTMGNGYLYAIALKESADGVYLVRSLGIQDASKIANFAGLLCDVKVLGSREEPKWIQTAEGLRIETSYRSGNPIVFKIKID